MNGFNKDQQVIHCRDGLSVIVDETTIGDKDYFVVHTLRGTGENIYVPKDRADVIIRPVMNQKEAEELLVYIKSIDIEFNTNTKQRRDALKRRLMSGDVKDIAHLFKQLYFYSTLNDPNIKYGPVDLEMLKYGSDNLLDELAVSFNKPRDEIQDFVYNKIK